MYVRVIGLSEFAPAARLGRGNGVKSQVDSAKSNRVLFNLCLRWESCQRFIWQPGQGDGLLYHHLGHVVAAPEAAGLVETLESGILSHASTISTHARGTAAWTRDTLTLRRGNAAWTPETPLPSDAGLSLRRPRPSRCQTSLEGQKLREN